MKFENITFTFKGAKYQVNDEYCNKCKADCDRGYCVENCFHVEEIPGTEWCCPCCEFKNINKLSTIKNEYVDCCNCKKTFEIETNDSGKIESITEFQD